jgi:phosphonoacetaldehyde hydrolase
VNWIKFDTHFVFLSFQKEPVRIKGIIFDFIGTTVIEKDPSLVNRCFADAFKDHGIAVGKDLIKANRGKDKKEMIAEVLSGFDLSPDLVEPILDSFKLRLENNLDNFRENEGAGDTIAYFKAKGILVGLGTGLPRDTFQTIFDHIGWSNNVFDYVGIASEVGRGRPYPDMIQDVLKKWGIQQEELLKLGDTVADILEGRNAGVMTAAILSGTQHEKDIRDQNPDLVIHSLRELKDKITGLAAEHPTP